MLANAVKTTAQVADDVLGSKTLKESAKHRFPTGIKKRFSDSTRSRDLVFVE